MVGERGFARIGWLAFFLAPGLGGLLVFTIGPLLASLVLTLFAWDLLTPPRFVGLENFTRLFSRPHLLGGAAPHAGLYRRLCAARHRRWRLGWRWR